MTRVGLGVQSDKSIEQYAALALHAERLGVDVLSVFSDLGYQPPLGALLTMAAHTSTIELGPACLNPYSLAPFEIAGQAAMLHAASDGRAYVGLARGAWLGAVGLSQPRPVTTLREATQVVRRLLAQDEQGFEGSVFTLEQGMSLTYEIPVPRPPVLLGTWGPRTAAVAGELADAVKVGGSANPDMAELMRDYVTVGTERAGRDPDDVEIVLGAVTVVDEDGPAARRKASTEVAMYLAVVGDLDPTVTLDADLLDEVRRHVDAGAHAEAGALIPDRVLDKFAFAGTPERVATQAGRVFDAGADRVEFGTPHGLSDLHGVDLIGRRVLPALQ